MKTLSHIALSSILALAGVTALPVYAQMAPMASGQSAPTEFTEAEVRKVDKDNKKITLRHAEIKNLGMPPMSMVFHVKDGIALDKMKDGDKVRFKAINDGGKFTVVEIVPVK